MAHDQAVGQGHVEQHQALSAQPRAKIDRVDVRVMKIPTEAPESDGTFTWDATTMITVEVCAAGAPGLGYTYGHAAVAQVVAGTLADVVRGRDPMAVSALWWSMQHAVRNHGRPGLVASAIAAVDMALWDLKARLLDQALVDLLGPMRLGVPLYGSGGFTSLSVDDLQAQLRGWVDAGIPRVKMKVGRDPGQDPARVRAARDAIGPDAALFVDANGAYTRKQALRLAEAFAAQGVSWFEEPVASDDLPGLRLLRDRAPPGMDITAGEYGYDRFYFQRMLEAGAVDVLQADGTRCMGISGLIMADALCAAHNLRLSLHTAPGAHLHAGAALAQVVHLEYFHDHTRIEHELLEGLPAPEHGMLHPDRSRPGHGLALCHEKADVYAL